MLQPQAPNALQSITREQPPGQVKIGGSMSRHQFNRHAEAGFKTVFINEAAYYPERIAFALTRPVTLEPLPAPIRSSP